MAIISYAEGKQEEWDSDLVSERLRNVLRCIAMKFDGIYITSLVRDPRSNFDLNGVAGSKHIPFNCYSHQCEACDFVLKKKIEPKELISYIGKHFRGAVILWHSVNPDPTVKEAWHFHLSTDLGKYVHLELM